MDAMKERTKLEAELYKVMAAEQREETLEAEARLGRSLTQKDNEYWQISEKYRQRYLDEIVAPRNQLSNAIKKQEESGRVDPRSSITQGERICVIDGCDNVIVPSGKRGRPAVKCESCRNKAATPKKKKVVDDFSDLEIIEA